MTGSDPKSDLPPLSALCPRSHAVEARWAVPSTDVRRPMTPTGTNLLGLVKHLGTVEFGYFGDTFGRK